jgi:TPR repeat protein
MAGIIGAMAGARTPALAFVERWFRAWIARFAPDPEALWLHWARHSHYPARATWYLERAAALGGREAQFQEALTHLEGGLGPGGLVAGTDRLRRAALRGHPEAAYRLAEALRTGLGGPLAEPAEALVWYGRAAGLGFGPAAAWLARAHADGDGVERDEAQARDWALRAEQLQPHPPLSRSLVRHDAAPGDPLAELAGRAAEGLEDGMSRALAHRWVRWVLLLGGLGLAGLALFVVGAFFWAGSSALFHMPLLMLLPPVLMLAWQAIQLRKDRPATGRDRLRKAAETGDPEACYQLGLAHQRGSHHCLRDDLSAAHWFRKAAEGGHRGALAALAEAYLGGHGVLRDRREAARWEEVAGRE